MLTIQNISTLPNLIQEFFDTGFPFNKTSIWPVVSEPAINIAENNDEYRIEIAVPGMNKEDFNVSIDKDVLKITAKKEIDKKDTDENYIRCEFSYSAFSRSFALPDTIDSDKIKAEYQNGVLLIYVPKREEAKVKPARTLKIS